MFRVQATCATGFAAALLLCAGNPVLGFNPQPEPPANQWGIEGFIDMTALIAEPTGTAMPFGLDSEIIGDEQVDFHAAIKASFIGQDTDGDLMLDDGIYAATTEFFELSLGDTVWSHTMFTRDFDFQLQRGVVTDVRGVFTETGNDHPDLAYMFQASPGAWVATDERFEDNLGTISGSYTLRDGVVVVPEPASIITWSLIILILFGIVTWRSR
jgi:hypothetical protein